MVHNPQPQPNPELAYRMTVPDEKLAEMDRGIERLERVRRGWVSYDRAEALFPELRPTGSPRARYSQQRLELARSQSVMFEGIQYHHHETLEAQLT